MPHPGTGAYRADKIELIVFGVISEYVEKLQKNKDVAEEIEFCKQEKKNALKELLEKERQALDRIKKRINVMEDQIPQAMTGEYPLSLEELVPLIDKQKQACTRQQKTIKEKEMILESMDRSDSEWKLSTENVPSWKQVFMDADPHTKRILINKLVEKIYIKENQVIIRFRIPLEESDTLLVES